MKNSLCHFLCTCAVLSAAAFASYSDVEISRRLEDDADLQEWLAAAKRVSPDVLKDCPALCSETGNSTSRAEWYLFPDATKLESCKDAMLLDMVVHPELEDDENTQMIIRACTADYDSRLELEFVPNEEKASLCSTPNQVLEKAPIYMHQPAAGNDADFSVNHLLSAGRQIFNYLLIQEPSCTNNAMAFAYFQSSIIGLFAGAEIHQYGVTFDVLKNLLIYAEEKAVSKTTVVQLCGAYGRGGDYSIGIVASSAKNLPFIQGAVKTWADGKCVSRADAGYDWMTVNLRVPSLGEAKSKNGTDVTTKLDTSPVRQRAGRRLSIRANCRTARVHAGDDCSAVADRCRISQSGLYKYNRANICNTLVKDEMVCCSSGTLPSFLRPGNSDGTCKTRTVIGGDSCSSLTSKCSVSATDFVKVNTKPNLCSTLVAGQQVCCTNGKMPDLKPKPDAKGNCATYMTKQDDSCSTIVAARDLNVMDLESFNKKTWGWNGCKMLYPNFKMCISTGNPPMPASVPVCFFLSYLVYI